MTQRQVKSEYLYLDLGDRAITGPTLPTTRPPGEFAADADFRVSRMGVNCASNLGWLCGGVLKAHFAFEFDETGTGEEVRTNRRSADFYGRRVPHAPWKILLYCRGPDMAHLRHPSRLVARPLTTAKRPAARAVGEDDKRALVRLAQVWEELAREAEKLPRNM